MWNIFEHWWTAILIALVVQTALALIHIIKPSTRKLWHILIPITILVAGFGVERMVKTDLEKIKILIESGIKAAKTEDAEAVNDLLAADYSDSCHNSKADMMNYCRQWFARPLVQNVKLYDLQIEISRPTAQINLAAFVHLDPKSGFTEISNMPLFVKVKLWLKKNAEKNWLIERAELVGINNQSVKWNQI